MTLPWQGGLHRALFSGYASATRVVLAQSQMALHVNDCAV
jgi:hypothetical protein